jgi:hypothetical protein
MLWGCVHWLWSSLFPIVFLLSWCMVV